MRYLDLCTRDFWQGDKVFGKGLADICQHLTFIANKYRYKICIFTFDSFRMERILYITTSVNPDTYEYDEFMVDIRERFGSVSEFYYDVYDQPVWDENGKFNVLTHNGSLYIVDGLISIDDLHAIRETREFIDGCVSFDEYTQLRDVDIDTADLLREVVSRYSNCCILFRFSGYATFDNLKEVYIVSKQFNGRYKSLIRQHVGWAYTLYKSKQLRKASVSIIPIVMSTITKKTDVVDSFHDNDTVLAGIRGSLVMVNSLKCGKGYYCRTE